MHRHTRLLKNPTQSDTNKEYRKLPNRCDRLGTTEAFYAIFSLEILRIMKHKALAALHDANIVTPGSTLLLLLRIMMRRMRANASYSGIQSQHDKVSVPHHLHIYLRVCRSHLYALPCSISSHALKNSTVLPIAGDSIQCFRLTYTDCQIQTHGMLKPSAIKAASDASSQPCRYQ